MSERKMVLREPTQAMNDAGGRLAFPDHWEQLGVTPDEIWRAMFDAAPAPPAAPSGVRVCPVKDIQCSTPDECGQRSTGCKMLIELPIPAPTPTAELCAELRQLPASIRAGRERGDTTCEKAAAALEAAQAENAQLLHHDKERQVACESYFARTTAAEARARELEQALRMLLTEVQSPRVPMFIANRDTWQPVIDARAVLSARKEGER